MSTPTTTTTTNNRIDQNVNNIENIDENDQQVKDDNSRESSQVESDLTTSKNNNKYNKEDIEKLIIDPITMSIMEEAVISTCGHSFDKKSITQWLERQSICPLCKGTLTLKDLTPNYTLRELISQFDKFDLIVNEDNEKEVQDYTEKYKENKEIASQISSMLEQLTVLSSKINTDINGNPTSPTSTLNNQPTSPSLPKKNLLIRELLMNECSTAAKLIESSTQKDPFMDYFFQDVYWRKSGSIWYCEKMLQYAVKRARVWGLFSQVNNKPVNQMIGVMIAQPPGQKGVSYTDMFKVGFAAAPLKMGMAPFSRVLSLYEISERVHGNLTAHTPHWYINAICIDPQFQNQHYGVELINTVIKLADSQKVAVYTDTAHPDSLRFFERHDFKTLRHVNDTPCQFYGLLRYPKLD